ncbi:MAG: hypothetical protein WC752_02730 [Patescibacteria group bacterium]|jgi:hypothetical protein
MEFLKRGRVAFNNKTYMDGLILINPDKIYFTGVKDDPNVRVGGAVGGIVGAAVGAAITGLQKKKEEVQDISKEPDFNSLSPETQNKLRKYPMYRIINKTDITGVKKNFLGLEFTTKTNEVYRFAGFFQKKAIAQSLQENNYPIA